MLMKSLIKISIIFLFVILLGSYGYSQDCKTKVTIKTDNDSSEIFVNNNFAGKGTAQLELSKGVYKISAKEPPSIWNAKHLEDTLVVSECGKELVVNMSFNNDVYLNSDPQDAYIYSKDSLVGFTPLFIPIGQDTLTLKKTGYAARSFLLSRYKSEDVIKLSAFEVHNTNNFFEGKEFKILAGSIVVLGAVTAYFKLKADDRFSQYQDTGDQSLLDQTRRYDLISGITMGALEINFGVLIYYFLTN